MDEWGRTDLSYQERIAQLDGSVSGGSNGSYLLNASDVYDNNAVNELVVGGGGRDWFFASAQDILRHERHTDVVTWLGTPPLAQIAAPEDSVEATAAEADWDQ